MLLEGAFFSQLISNFKTKFSFPCLPLLSGVKNKMLNNGLILTEKNMLYKSR